MEIALWIVQILAGFIYIYTAVMLLTQTREQVVDKGLGVIANFDRRFLKLIGLLQLLGAIGMILPHRLNILPFLSPIASICLLILMIAAFIIHLRQNDIQGTVPSIITASLTIFILWQTFSLLPL